MADITAQDYQDAVAAMAPNSGVSPEERTFAIQIKQEFEDQHAAQQGAAAPQQGLADKLDPSLSLMPQALAVQPATTYPGGDTKAEDAWLIDRGKSAKGTVIYYEPPLSVAKKDLLEHPEIGRMLYPNLDQVIDPEAVANLKASDPLFDDYKNHKWREAAEAAAKSGKTVYRYSKAPYLQSDGAMGKLSTLGLKAVGSVEPAISGLTSFVGGLDKAAAFGAGNKIADATADTTPEPPAVPNPSPPYEFVGGTAGAQNEKDYRALSTEEHPLGNYGGQALGMLADWSPSNLLFAKAAGLGGRAAQAAGGSGAARLAGSVGAAAGAGAVDQGIRQGVNAAGDLAEHGETPITLGGAAQSMGHAAMITGALGGGLDLLGGAADTGANTIANGTRYRGIPGQLERAGFEFSPKPTPGGGVVLSPETQELVSLAQKTDTQPGEMLAKEIAPKIKDAADQEVKGAIENVTARKQAYYKTSEGQMKLPAQNLVDRSIQILRRKHEENAGSLQALDVSGTTGKVKGIFNNEVETVSTKPVPGAIELSPQEAETFLDGHWQGKLKPDKAGVAGSGAREIDLEGAAPTDELGLATDLQRQGVKTVYVVPRRHDAQSFEEVLHGIKGFRSPSGEGNSARELQELDNAARLDRDARPLAGEPGGWSDMQAEHAALLGASKSLERLVSPGGEPFKVLTGYGQPKTGELLTVEALRKAADKGGVREQLETIRNLDRVQRLKAAGNYGPPVGGGARFGGGFFSPAAHADAATLRAFPVLRKLGGPESFIRGGRGGVLGVGQGDDQKEKQ